MRAALLLAASTLALGACSSIGSGAGAVVGIASGAGSGNPLVGAAVGLGTKAAVDALVLYISRSRQHAEQDAIADAAGALDAGGTAPWKIVHPIPLFDDEHGTLRVADVVANPLATCKEVVFTVDADKQHDHYVTTECRQDSGQAAGHWRWAKAEPATSRWGFLQ